MLNRQAKLPGETEWTSYGNVSLAQAAIIHFALNHWPPNSNQKFAVLVRDEEDGKVFSIDCQYKRSIQVSNLRGNT